MGMFVGVHSLGKMLAILPLDGLVSFSTAHDVGGVARTLMSLLMDRILLLDSSESRIMPSMLLYSRRDTYAPISAMLLTCCTGIVVSFRFRGWRRSVVGCATCQPTRTHEYVHTRLAFDVRFVSIHGFQSNSIPSMDASTCGMAFGWDWLDPSFVSLFFSFLLSSIHPLVWSRFHRLASSAAVSPAPSRRRPLLETDSRTSDMASTWRRLGRRSTNKTQSHPSPSLILPLSVNLSFSRTPSPSPSLTLCPSPSHSHSPSVSPSPSVSFPLSLPLTPSHSQSVSITLTLSVTHSLSHSLTLCHPHSQSLTPTHCLNQSLTPILSVAILHPLSLNLTHILAHTHTQSHALAHTLFLCVSLPSARSLFVCPSITVDLSHSISLRRGFSLLREPGICPHLDRGFGPQSLPCLLPSLSLPLSLSAFRSSTRPLLRAIVSVVRSWRFSCMEEVGGLHGHGGEVDGRRTDIHPPCLSWMKTNPIDSSHAAHDAIG